MRKNDSSGQAVVEYILILAVMVSFFVTLLTFVNRFRLGEKLAQPIRENYRRAYQFGHPKAKGYDDPDGPDLHPRATTPQDRNFRIFFNPHSG